MKEIEILVEINDVFESAFSKLEKFNYLGAKKTIDTYYYDPKRDNLKLNSENKLMECCRVREKDGRYSITYKVDIYNEGVWDYSNEYETNIDDIISIKLILQHLGLKELVVIENVKYTFLTDIYEIVLEDVSGLGCFLEVEYKNDDSDIIDVYTVKKEILDFIKKTGINIGEELNSGKPELLLIKNSKRLI